MSIQTDTEFALESEGFNRFAEIEASPKPGDGLLALAAAPQTLVQQEGA